MHVLHKAVLHVPHTLLQAIPQCPQLREQGLPVFDDDALQLLKASYREVMGSAMPEHLSPEEVEKRYDVLHSSTYKAVCKLKGIDLAELHPTRWWLGDGTGSCVSAENLNGINNEHIAKDLDEVKALIDEIIKARSDGREGSTTYRSFQEESPVGESQSNGLA